MDLQSRKISFVQDSINSRFIEAKDLLKEIKKWE
jgi:hypothetical protein